MKRKYPLYTVFLFLIHFGQYIDGTIRVVCTAAIVPTDYEIRKSQYIKSIQRLKSYGYEPYIIESCQAGPTFLDEYCNHVCYTQSNNSSVNKGTNEGISLNQGLKYFSFDPEDMIIKLTGRYCLETDEFIRLVEKNPDADAIARAWNDRDGYTALFALRVKYFYDFLNNHIVFERDKHAFFEHLFGNYITKIKNQGAKIVYLPRVYNYLPVAFANLR